MEAKMQTILADGNEVGIDATGLAYLWEFMIENYLPFKAITPTEEEIQAWAIQAGHIQKYSNETFLRFDIEGEYTVSGIPASLVLGADNFSIYEV